VAGAGTPAAKDWEWLYKKIVSLGKGVVVDEHVDSERLLNICSDLRTARIYFRFYHASSKDEVEQTLDRLKAVMR
jgi:hypothetical protein